MITYFLQGTAVQVVLGRCADKEEGCGGLMAMNLRDIMRGCSARRSHLLPGKPAHWISSWLACLGCGLIIGEQVRGWCHSDAAISLESHRGGLLHRE